MHVYICVCMHVYIYITYNRYLVLQFISTLQIGSDYTPFLTAGKDKNNQMM